MREHCHVSADLARHDRESSEAADRAMELDRLEQEERASTVMPEDLMHMVADHIGSTPYEVMMWNECRKGNGADDAEIGRLIRRYVAIVREEQAVARAKKRMEQLVREIR